MDHKDIVIIGAGPAGSAAAIQLRRYNLSLLVFEANQIGGLLRNADRIENYPGFSEGIAGQDLVKLLKDHLRNAGIKVNFEKVKQLDYEKEKFCVETDKRKLSAEIVIVASGTKPRRIPDLPIHENVKEKIFYEVFELRRIKDKKVVVIGGGDAAFDYAMNLSKRNDVIILNRSGKVKCIPVLEKRVKNSKKIIYRENIEVKSVQKSGNGLVLKCVIKESKQEELIKSDYLLIAVGREPCLDFLGKIVKKNLEYLTGIDRLHFIGDVKNDIYRQAGISVGDGIKTAMRISRVMGA